MPTEIPDSERLIVALDYPAQAQARALVEELGDSVEFYKVGLELFMDGGSFELVDWLTGRGKQVFVDLKFFDVPATVGRAVGRLKGRGIRFTTVHGNDAMMRAAAEAERDFQVLAVTVLTSLDQGDLDDLGFDCDVNELVISRARRAVECGCDGVIASGQARPAPGARRRVPGGVPRHPPGGQRRRPEADRQRAAGLRKRRRLHRGRPADPRRRRPRRGGAAYSIPDRRGPLRGARSRDVKSC